MVRARPMIVGQDDRRSPRKFERVDADPGEPPEGFVQPVEAADGEEGEREDAGSSCARPIEQSPPRHADPAVPAQAKRREGAVGGHQHRSELDLAQPGGAEQDQACHGQEPVAADQPGQPRRIVGRDIGEQEGGEQGEQENGRPDAEGFGQGERGGAGADQPMQSGPRIDPAPEVAEEAGERHQADPAHRPEDQRHQVRQGIARSAQPDLEKQDQNGQREKAGDGARVLESRSGEPVRFEPPPDGPCRHGEQRQHGECHDRDAGSAVDFGRQQQHEALLGDMRSGRRRPEQHQLDGQDRASQF